MHTDCSLYLSSKLTGDPRGRANENVEGEAWEKVLFYRPSRWLPACHSARISRVSICGMYQLWYMAQQVMQSEDTILLSQNHIAILASFICCSFQIKAHNSICLVRPPCWSAGSVVRSTGPHLIPVLESICTMHAHGADIHAGKNTHIHFTKWDQCSTSRWKGTAGLLSQAFHQHYSITAALWNVSSHQALISCLLHTTITYITTNF